MVPGWRIALAVLSLPWLAAALLMLVTFATPRGLGAALWTVCLLATLWWFSYSWKGRGVLLGLTLSLLVALLAVYPRPGPYSNLNFPTAFDYLFNFVPEQDLARLGVRLAYGPPLSDHVLGLLEPLYQEMGERYGPHVVGSTASDLLLRRPGRLHFFQSAPATTAKGVLVFYHGALGGFQVYLHFWKHWADEHGWAVICPSNGFGRWYDSDGPVRALDSFDMAVATYPGVPVVVVGMSNGGTAAMRVVNARPEQVSGLMLVCPVLEKEQVTRATFLHWTQTHPAPVVLEGTEDVNVPPESVEQGVGRIKAAGGRVDYRLLPGHDHHILFSAGRESYELVDGLLAKLGSGTDKSL